MDEEGTPLFLKALSCGGKSIPRKTKWVGFFAENE
jgi:hypothetical protein